MNPKDLYLTEVEGGDRPDPFENVNLTIQCACTRYGMGVGEVNALYVPSWPEEARHLVLDLFLKLDLASDQIKQLGGKLPF